jgi:hypothetical protein
LSTPRARGPEGRHQYRAPGVVAPGQGSGRAQPRARWVKKDATSETQVWTWLPAAVGFEMTQMTIRMTMAQVRIFAAKRFPFLPGCLGFLPGCLGPGTTTG